MDWASTSSYDRLFHLSMTLGEKYKCESQRQCFFANFQVGLFEKKCDQGVGDNYPFIILNNSIKSALFLLSCRDHSPNWRSLVSYGNGLGWRKIRIKVVPDKCDDFGVNARRYHNSFPHHDVFVNVGSKNLLHSLWGVAGGVFSYNSPKTERIWVKPVT